MPTPRMDTLEPRRLFALTAGGFAPITGAGYQSAEKIVTLPNDGYIVAGTFGQDTDGISSPLLGGEDETNLFLRLVTNTRQSTQTLGSKNGGRVKFSDDRVDFVSLPRRIDDTNVPLGVSTAGRRADSYVSQMKIGPDGKLYVSVVFKEDFSLNAQNPRARLLKPDDSFEKSFYDSALLCYDISGGKFLLQNIKQIGGPFNDVVTDFAFDNGGNLLLTGSFERDCDFDPSRRKAIYQPDGRGDAFVAKYNNATGKLLFVAQFGGDADVREELDASNSIAIAADNSVYLGGTFASDAEFAINGRRTKDVANADDGTDAFTMRLNANGTLDWVRVQGGDDFDGIRAVTLSPDGGVYSAGYFSDEADVDPRASSEQIFTANDQENDSETPTDAFFTRFDADGNVVIVKQLSGTGYEIISSAATNASGDLVLAGSFSGTLDFDPSRRTRLVTTPDSDNDDANENDRDNAYAGFIVVYRADSRLRYLQTLLGRLNQDAFVNGASLGTQGRIAIAGRSRGGIIAGGAESVTSNDFDDYKEDGYSLIFIDSFETFP